MVSSYKTFTLANQLTAEQINFFNQYGFIHFKNFITPETVSSIIDASKEVEQKWIDNDLQKVNGVPIKYGKDLDGSPIVQRFAFINQHHQTLSGLLLDPRFNSLLQLAGDGARLGTEEKDGMVFNHYINGPESKFTKMGWHTDGLRDIFYGTKLNPMLNVGIHLSSLKPENGGLKIIPGTHKQSIYQMLFRKKYFLDHKEDPDEVSIIPEAGDLTIHDGRLWHRVAESSIRGEESRRRVIYIPIIAGKYAPKNENSPTVFYQRFAGIVK
ncbi:MULTISPECIES: phytanoyl-CoA dioxygenase family protein [Flavobacterium]|jgi:ectoine hydroxylase-related dioxygenase (phytanoyl-CoA dioxygenase family)|uniref:Phytanoyl-CoA dioxygenase (PhyH) n=1 Tax=Flavobacterium anhuiense TaxID=459526 RepID=A0AAC9GKS5_9FLAO|nr:MULTISPECIES: phytanoyl-CoA dioxygenase family protein [Flavobacterium]AOC96561.1 Phytanoyl-CoA dioxygenase (PhyH) [Flavobacterium anhuiense]EJF99247.1 phytanoyl-CoA dioxygenase [Flavobacterium sp. F52]MXO04886.1 phytanoyl-CoA dioxygenase [Flavobacterium sp. HBTb2-11-1]URM36076.1 phytanoyl-CoA dioxygenase family protein [Flavobacterium anhuiense]SCY77579.1 Ectoine hydroxylase-related dioxygenase, phytanoyl-CoA dioxygenase (PhyH) family [Flavobacterium anhuiense]